MANTTKSKKRGGTRMPLAMSMLAADHKAVSKLFKSYESTEERQQKRSILQQICAALTAHAQLEEELFYPALRSGFDGEDAELLDEAEVEHSTVKALVGALENAKPGDDLVDAKVKVLSEYVKHHVREEEDEIFPKAKKAKDVDFDALGERMQQRKQQLEASAGIGEEAPGGNGSRGSRRSRTRAPVGAH